MAQIQFRSDDSSLWEEKFGAGGDGALTISTNTTDAPTKTICSGTIASKTLSVGSSTGFAVNDLVLIHQTRNGSAGVGTWQLNKILNISGITWTLKYELVGTFDTTSQVQKLNQYSSVTVNSGITWTSSAWDGSSGGILAFLCNGTTTVTGNISASGKGYRGGNNNTSATGAQSGEGTSGAQVSASSSANGNGGGGITTGNGGAGGGGGNGTAGTIGSAGSSRGAGGAAAGVAGLTTMVFGGGGGGAVDGSSTAGKPGGGIILIISKDLTVTGTILDKGDNAGNAQATGGAGAGGSVLIKTQVATLGSSLITATGGTQGTGGYALGGAGGTGRIHLDYLTSYTGTTSPTIDVRQDTSLTLSGGSGASAAFLFLMA